MFSSEQYTQTKSKSSPKSVLVKKGVYGCAYSPPLPCKKSKYHPESRKKVIGKLTTKREVEDELVITEAIQKIPNYTSYFIVQELDNCSTANFDRMRPTYAPDCDHYQESSSKELYQLLSTYGGIDMHKYNPDSSFNFMDALKQVLKAVAVLEEHGICHTDLHSGNLVRDVRGKIRIIDYGMAFLGDNVSESYVDEYLKKTHYSPEYNQIPPEFTVAMAVHNGIPLSRAISECIHGKPIITKAQNDLGIGMTLVEQERHLREFFQIPGMYELMTKEPLEFFKLFWRKVDVWSVGALFLKILKKLLLSPHFIEMQWKANGVVIRTVLKGLLQANPNLRLSPHEALAKLAA